MSSGKKAQHDFPKMRGGGIKGRLELFQKFIRFGIAALPLARHPPASPNTTKINLEN